MQKYFNNIVNSSGRPVVGASVFIQTHSASAAATIFSDNSGTPKANPTSTDANGYFEFYAEDGRYNIVISGSGIGTLTISDVLIEDPADGADIHAADSKATPVDADEMPLADSAASFGLKKLTLANLKAMLKTYFDMLYAAVSHAHAGTYEPANANIQTHVGSTSNPHGVTAAQVGLGNVTNESKATMFSSPAFTGTATAEALTATGNVSLGDAEATDTHAIKGAATMLASSASAALRITQSGGGNALEVEGAFGAGNSASELSFKVVPIASSMNYLAVRGEATGNTPTLFSTGSDTNVSSFYSAKGSGAHRFFTGHTGDGVTGALEQFRVTHAASAVNAFLVNGNVTTAPPVLRSFGADADIAANIAAKGTGPIYLQAPWGTTQFVVAATASAVNYAQVSGGATGNGVSLAAQGSDSNVPFLFISKGSSPAVVRRTSDVNYFAIYGGTTGNAVVVQAEGSDSNIDLALSGKGTGVLKFGTWTSSADVAINGYVTIKDAAGNTRKLATIA